MSVRPSDLDAFLHQINDLEESSRREKANYEREVALHNLTKKELDKVQAELKVAKEETEQLKDSFAEASTRAESSEKMSSQLKEALKESKNESASLRETVEKEAKNMRERRDWFLKEMDKVNDKLRNMRTEYSKCLAQLYKHKTKVEDQSKLEVLVERLGNEIFLEQAVPVIEQKPEVPEKMEVEKSLIEQGVQTEQVPDSESEEKAKSHRALIEQMQSEYDQMQEYLANLENLLQRGCPQCGAPLVQAQ